MFQSREVKSDSSAIFLYKKSHIGMRNNIEWWQGGIAGNWGKDFYNIESKGGRRTILLFAVGRCPITFLY